MKLVFKRAPRLPMPTVAPRGPSVQLTPDPLTFIRMPGASLMDRRKRSAMASSLGFLYAACYSLYITISYTMRWRMADPESRESVYLPCLLRFRAIPPDSDRGGHAAIFPLLSLTVRTPVGAWLGRESGGAVCSA